MIVFVHQFDMNGVKTCHSRDSRIIGIKKGLSKIPTPCIPGSNFLKLELFCNENYWLCSSDFHDLQFWSDLNLNLYCMAEIKWNRFFETLAWYIFSSSKIKHLYSFAHKESVTVSNIINTKVYCVFLCFLFKSRMEITTLERNQIEI